jgi:hypothetical protein
MNVDQIIESSLLALTFCEGSGHLAPSGILDAQEVQSDRASLCHITATRSAVKILYM